MTAHAHAVFLSLPEELSLHYHQDMVPQAGGDPVALLKLMLVVTLHLKSYNL